MKAGTHRYLLFGSVAALVLMALLWSFLRKDSVFYTVRDYPQIEADGILKVVTEYNPTGYYVEGDSLAGFHYDLVREFAEAHRLEVTFCPEMSFERRLQGVESGEFDLVASDMAGTSALKDRLALTAPLMLGKQVLVQRIPKTGEDSALFVANQLDLAGKIIHVVKGDPAILRIHNLGSEIGDTIYVVELDRYGPEQLIAMVAHGDINYTVCNELMAKAVADSFPQLAPPEEVGFTQFISWGVNHQSRILLDSLNVWLEDFRKTDRYKAIHKKYFGE